MYRKLVEFHRQDKLSFKYVTTFNMDEYVGTYAHTLVQDSIQARDDH